MTDTSTSSEPSSTADRSLLTATGVDGLIPMSTHTITLDSYAAKHLTVDKTSASAGETVSVTVNSPGNFCTVFYTPEGELPSPVAPDDLAGTALTFTMPDKNVTITYEQYVTHHLRILGGYFNSATVSYPGTYHSVLWADLGEAIYPKGLSMDTIMKIKCPEYGITYVDQDGYYPYSLTKDGVTLKRFTTGIDNRKAKDLRWRLGMVNDVGHATADDWDYSNESLNNFKYGDTNYFWIYLEYSYAGPVYPQEETLSFDSRGGSAVASEQVRMNTLATKPADPTRDGYTFDGWYYDSACTEPVDWTQILVEYAPTYYAKWSLDVTVSVEDTGSYDAEGAFHVGADWLSPTSVTVDEGSAESILKTVCAANNITYVSNKDYNPYSLSKDDVMLSTYILNDAASYWMLTINGSYISKASAYTVKPGDKIVLRYHPMDIGRTITFDSRGGSDVASIKIAYGTVATKPADPTRENYTFGGWYTDCDCTTAVNWTTAVTASGTYYAKWTHDAATTWTELAGANRYDTMAAIVGEGSFATGGTVIVASGETFPDALAASAFAGAEDAPIVLTAGNALSEQAKTLLVSLKPASVIILGGDNTISADVATEIETACGVTPTRIAGANRAQTAVEIYAMGKGVYGAAFATDTCIIASGSNESQGADALAISAYAYSSKTPIFLVGSDGMLPDEAVLAITSAGFKHIIVCGGTNSVSDNIGGQLTATAPQFTRLSGTTRYETACDIAEWETGHSVTYASAGTIGFKVTDVAYGKPQSLETLAVATGTNFPDALASTSLIGSKSGVLLLANPSATNGGPCVEGMLPKYGDETLHGYFLGGIASLPQSIRTYCEDNTQ